MTFTRSGETDYAITGAGPTIVLVHGLGMTRAMWAPLLPAFAARFRVVSYDLAGLGNSPPPVDPVVLGSFSGQLARLMDELAIAAAPVIGFSLGGMIVRRFALDHPARVAAMVVLNSPHDRTSQERDAVRLRVEQVRRDGPGATIDGAIERWFTPAYQAAHPEAIADIRATILRNKRAVYAKLYAVLAEGEPELAAAVAAISAPTLVMTCDDDRGNTPDMSRRMAALIPGAELAIVPGLRHMGLWEAPDRFTGPIIDVLTRRLGS